MSSKNNKKHQSIEEQSDSYWMNYAIRLASSSHTTSPNPMVGAVIVSKDNTLLGEGFHKEPGTPHAEPLAISSATTNGSISDATLYVTLEPCNHYGLTPPCTQSIINSGLRHVVLSCKDPNPLVSGRGISALREAGITLKIGVESEKGAWLNRRFFTYHRLKRPYIILKWAQSEDKFLGLRNSSQIRITSAESCRLNHTWRAREDAILVGTETAIWDNPHLTVREVDGKNPVRVALDTRARIPITHNLFDNTSETVMVGPTRLEAPHVTFIDYSSDKDPFLAAIDALYNRSNLSVIVEGGAKVLSYCIENNLWDEVRVFISNKSLSTLIAEVHHAKNDDARDIPCQPLQNLTRFTERVHAPATPSQSPAITTTIGEDTLAVWYNTSGIDFLNDEQILADLGVK